MPTTGAASRSAAWPTPAGVVLSFVALAGAAAGAARRRRAARLGLPAAVAGGRRGAGRAVHADRPEPGRRVRVRLGAAEQRWPRCSARHPLVDSLLTGVLAVAVASPCTAPFMGASLGLAVTLPAVQALAVFAALGLGMALPYLAASLWPGAGARAAAAGRVDGALQAADGLPDVRHRGLAGLGARPADRHRRRRRTAGAAGGAGLRRLGAGHAGHRPQRARRASACVGAGSCLAAALALDAAGAARPRAAAGRAAMPRAPARLAAWSAERVAAAACRRPARCSSTSPRPGA